MKKQIKKIFLYLLIFSFFNYTACYSSKTVGKESFFSESREEPLNDITIVKTDDERIIMDEVTYQVVEDTVYLEGVDKSNSNQYGKLINEKIALVDIQYVKIEKLSESKTIGCIVGLTGIVVLLIAVVASVSSAPKRCGPPSDLSDWD
jgi:hypothetical protein